MKGAAFFDLVAKMLPAANSFRLIGIVAGVAVSLATLAVTGGPVLIGAWKHRHAAAAQAKRDARLGEASAAIGAEAVAAQAEHAATILRIETRTQEAAHAVQSAPGAEARAPDVAFALHDALCLSDAYAREPDCAALRADRRGVGAAALDPGREPAD